MKKTEMTKTRTWAVLLIANWCTLAAMSSPTAVPLEHATITVGGQGKPISTNLVGIFFEDLNYAADGGLYAELVQNRSFEYSAADRKEWSALTSWEMVQRGDAKGTVQVATNQPLNTCNTHYAVLTVEKTGSGAGLMNAGYDGIPVKTGEAFKVSLFSRLLSGQLGALTVRLESAKGALLGEVRLPAPIQAWAKHEAMLTPVTGDPAARLVVLISGTGSLALDMVSLFPAHTFHDHPNGLRADLAQTIADLKPKFMRFPGGCLAHGRGVENMYRWKETIGPVEQRRGQFNLWGYHQSVGLGYFEYFQFCEDIGASPLPVVAAGVSCQFARPPGQRGIPMAEMPAYVQEILDLIEYANGSATSVWGAKRAAAGHPAPFNLKYIGVGNEDAITPAFKERFTMIDAAVRAKYPGITVVGTAGPGPDGRDYDEAWKLARQQHLMMLDEHYYKDPEWFWKNLHRYDRYDRASAKVYVGEYAAHEKNRANTLRSALAEAAHLTALERNADVAPLASYAPLLSKEGHTQWRPDLIYFDNTRVTRTLNYDVQRLFSENGGDTALPSSVDEGHVKASAPGATLAVSCVKDSKSGDVILKIVSRQAEPVRITVDLSAAGVVSSEAAGIVLAGNPDAVNEFGKAPVLAPRTVTVAVAPTFIYEAPAWSLSVIRLKTK